MPNKVKIEFKPNVQWYIVTGLVALLGGMALFLGWIAANILFSLVIFLYFKYKYFPIITSLLDTDWYKLTMGQLVFHQFPDAKASYCFINRGKTEFPPEFAEHLKYELQLLSHVQLTYEEWVWLADQFVLSQDYIDWLSNHRFNPKQVKITQTDGNLDITIEGPWVETILWEVPLMAIISELYFRLTGKTYDPHESFLSIKAKAEKLNAAGVKWSDFGTRRRFSKDTQADVNAYMSVFKGFIGTSNPYFAMKYNIWPIGTYAHEAVMAMQALYNAEDSNKKWMEHWLKEYCLNPQMLIALTDTLTTDVFLRTYKFDLLRKFVGVRQDSGNPHEFAKKIIQYYKDNNVNPKTQKIIFSDGLDVDKAIAIHNEFKDEIQCVMGIGTNLTNDCGYKPLNMVIKLTAIDFGDGFKPVVKLSDDEGKHTGSPERILEVKKELQI
jgi:nicotinate phosphoribosyltransferase